MLPVTNMVGIVRRQPGTIAKRSQPFPRPQLTLNYVSIRSLVWFKALACHARDRPFKSGRVDNKMCIEHYKIL